MGEVRMPGCGIVTESSGLQVLGTLSTFAIEVENHPAAPPSMGLPPSLPHCASPLT